MKIISMHILLKKGEKPILLKSVYELGFMSILTRQMAKGPLNFAAVTCVNKIHKNELVKVELSEIENANLFAQINEQGIAAVIIADIEYPDSAAKRILKEIHTKFSNLYKIEDVQQYNSDQNLKFPELDKMVKKYQDPKEADKLMKIESELDEIQGMLTKTMADLLDRGEKLDDLMKDSEYISNTAFNFYQKSKEANNKCCSLY